METTIYCTRQLRRLWPDPLALQWRLAYPNLFDGDDWRLLKEQPKYHSWEWRVAMHLQHGDGV